MPRRARILLDGVALHLIQRGNNRCACFFADDDYLFYLDTLAELCEELAIRLHAYCLMTNHVHLLLRNRGRHRQARQAWQGGTEAHHIDRIADRLATGGTSVGLRPASSAPTYPVSDRVGWR